MYCITALGKWNVRVALGGILTDDTVMDEFWDTVLSLANELS